MVHYLSAGMATSPEKRAVEAKWMATFDDDFAARHAAAFEAQYRHMGLDYFGIDCAELPDGPPACLRAGRGDDRPRHG